MKAAQKLIILGVCAVFIAVGFFMWVSAGCADSESDLKYIEGEINHGKLLFDGIDRDYAFYIPGNFKKLESKSPLVFALHGFNMPLDAMIMVNASMHPLADEDGTIIIYPKATGSFEQGNLHWNDLSGLFPSSDKVDDVGYISFLIDFFIKNYNGDPDRVYVTGQSNGGIMTYTLSCMIPEKLAAVAPMISQISASMAKKHLKAKPLPIIIVNGNKDPLLPPEGGVSKSGRHSLLSVDENIEYWVKRNNIIGKPVTMDFADITQEQTDGIVTPSTIKGYFWFGNGKKRYYLA